MGGLVSRFWRKQTTFEILEGIDKDINRLQKNRKVNQDRQKQFVTSLLIYSIIVYVIAAVVFFCIYFPETWQLRLLYSLPLLVFPFLIWGIKKILHWYFVKRISSNDLALQHLREKKKQILEDVMETETYKRAREILEKFDPVRLRKLEMNSPEAGQTTGATPVASPGTTISQRSVRPTPQARAPTTTTSRLPAPLSPTQTPTALKPKPATPTFQPSSPTPQIRPELQVPTPVPLQMTAPVSTLTSTPSSSNVTRTPLPAQPVMRGGFSAAPPGVPMPRSVLPRERGTMDRLMDYLVGDGPENRYALVCQMCYSHNGMALKEEFEYLSFRCCYCFALNPAKKQRPLAPKLEFFAPLGSRRESSSDKKAAPPSNEESDDDDIDDEDDDNDSLESDASDNGGPPTKSLTSTVSTTSSKTSSATALKPVKTPSSLDRCPPSPSETEHPNREEARKSVLSSDSGISRSDNQASKIGGGQISARGIPVAIQQQGQTSKLPVGHTSKSDVKESTTEPKETSQATKALSSEKSGLPRLVSGRLGSESSKERELHEAKTRIPVPSGSHEASPDVN